MNYSKLFEKLVSSDKPIKVLWDALFDLWSDRKSKYQSAEDYYDNGEENTSELENFIFRVYRELYSKVVHSCLHTPSYSDFLMDLMSRVKTVFIVDGMSVREVPFILDIIEKHDYKVEDISHSYSAIPSDTVSFMKRMTGKEISPKYLGNKIEDVAFAYAEKETDSFPAYRQPFLLWLSKPDVFFTSRASTSIQNMLNETLTLFEKSLKTYTPPRLLITSDHGYIMDKHNWELPKNPAFEGSKRNTLLNELTHDGVETFEEIEKEGRAISVGRYGLLVGRYQRRGGPHIIGFHGGASFTELLVPRIILTRR